MGVRIEATRYKRQPDYWTFDVIEDGEVICSVRAAGPTDPRGREVAERILAAINGDTVPAPTLPDALLAERVAEGHLPTLAPEIGLHAIGRLYAADVQPIPDSHDVEWMRGRITLGVAVEPQSIPVRMGATYVIAQVVHP